MGLDITAYETAIELPPHEYSEGTAENHWEDSCYDLGHERVFVYVGFEQSARGLVLYDNVKHYDGGTGIRYGPCYQVDRGKSFGFRAGSYGGYNAFRDALSQAALGVPAKEVFLNPDEYLDKPFFELINFADNEGTIGPEAAADLYKDFVDWGEKIVNTYLDDSWFREKYEDWTKAFKLAGGSGIVDFH